MVLLEVAVLDLLDLFEELPVAFFPELAGELSPAPECASETFLPESSPVGSELLSGLLRPAFFLGASQAHSTDH